MLAWSLLAFVPVIRNDFVNWDDFTAEGRLQEAEVHFRRAAEMDGSAWPLESLARAPGGAGRVRGGRLATGRIPARLPWLLGALVAVWTLVTFLPTVWNDFVNWDDPRMFLENPYHRGPWLQEFRYAWSSHLLGEFMPVTWMSYTLDRMLWGLHAPGYHLTSLILHVLAALAVFVLARRLLRHALGPDVPGGAAIDVGAAAAALTFAAHPLRVEAVAWVSARGTVLGGLLLILAVLVYVIGWERGQKTGTVPAGGSRGPWPCSSLRSSRARRAWSSRRCWWSWTSTRSGGSAGPRWGGGDQRPGGVWREKAVFAVVGALATPMGFLARGEEVGDFPRAGWDPPIALAWAVYSTGFYVWKSVGVGILSPIYAMPSRDEPMLGAVLLSAVTAAAITGVLFAMRRRWPGALAAWIAYLILLGPMSGIVPFGRLRGAVDRYTYVACLGWALVVGGAIVVSWRAARGGRGAGSARDWRPRASSRPCWSSGAS